MNKKIEVNKWFYYGLLVLLFVDKYLQAYKDELVSKMPHKQELVLQQTKLTDYQKGFNEARKQFINIIKGES